MGFIVGGKISPHNPQKIGNGPWKPIHHSFSTSNSLFNITNASSLYPEAQTTAI